MSCVWYAAGQTTGGRKDTIRAAKLGGPSLNLSDGQIVESRYQGAAASALRNNSANPLALASADFDEDGMPDLASGYESAGGGIITIHRGNVNALWPYGEAIRHGQPPAFLPDVRTFELPEQPDFLGAGDFDADGHWDIVAAHRGSSALWLLRGDGHGGFYPAERIPLPGGVTALVTGELNRPDGLTDIAVAVAGNAADGSSAQVLVFESPTGALRGEPEAFLTPTAASALAVGLFDADFWNDLAVGAGKELIIVHSRDRKLSLPKSIRSHVPPAKVTRQTLPFAVRSLASGFFASHRWTQLAALGGDGKVHMLERSGAREIPETTLAIPGMDGTIRTPPGKQPPSLSTLPLARSLANDSADLVLRDEIEVPGLASFDGAPPQLVAARVSAGGTHDLIVIHGAAQKLHVISKDRDSAEPALKLAASLDASAAPMAVLPMRLHPHPLSDLIVLESDRAEPQLLHPEDVINFIVTNTNDSGAGSLRAAIDGSTQTQQGASSITFNIPITDPNRDPATGVFTITPIGVLNGFNNVLNAEPLLGAPTLTLDAYTQPGASPNTLTNGDNAVVLIRIDGAKGGVGSVGLDSFEGTSDTIRGFMVTGFTQPLSLPSGDNTGGTAIEPDGSNGFIEGNFVGTNSTGTAALTNYNGILTFGSSSAAAGNTIGGTTPQARNLLSGNSTGFGSALVAVPNTYFVQGNYIGTDATGTKALANGQGAGGAAANIVIGGTVAGAGNLISANNGTNIDSITIASNTFGASYIVQGNLIGTDYTGAAAIGNLALGVDIGSINHTGNQFPTSVDNTIGGTTPAARNIISGNTQGGIFISDGADTTLVQGNYIGLDVSGTKALGNGSFSNSDGIFNGIVTGASNSTPPANTTIGGEFPGSGNVISANSGNGIQILGLGSAFRLGNNGEVLQPLGNTVEGNLIGTDASGVNALPNQANGIYVNTGSAMNLIGDPGYASGNLIAFNALNGILVDPGTTGTGNSVSGNTIFSNTGAGVRMASGTASPISRNSIFLNGKLGIDTATAGPNTISTCGSSSATPTLLQNAPVLVSTAGSAIITATATDPSGNTSEFSNCALATPINNVVNVTGTLAATEPNVKYTVELFQNDSCDASGFGQGKHFLTNLSLTTNSVCATPISVPIDLSKADLSVTLSGQTFQSAGNTFIMSSVVSNLGAANATGVVYTAKLPSGFTFTSATTTLGTCANASGTVTCTIGNLASGATVNLTVTVNITTLTAGNYVTMASVAGAQVDPNSANNSASLTVNVTIPFPQISSFTPAYLLAGSPTSTVSVIGSGFFPGTTVTFNNVAVASTFVNGRTINIVVPAALLANYGMPPVTVSNGTGQFQSDTMNFFVRVACTFTLTPASAAVGAAGTSGSTFNVTAPAGCYWFAQGDFTSSIVSATTTITDSDGDLNGSGTVTFSMPANTGAPAIHIVKILPTTPDVCFDLSCGGALGTEADFTIYQGGAFNCTFSLPVSSVNVPVGGVVGEGANGQGTGAATFFVNVSNPACIPSAATNVTWITQEGSGGNTDQWEEDYNVSANTGQARTGQIIMTGLASVTGNTPNLTTLPFTVNQAGTPAPVPASVTATGGTPQTTGVGMPFGTALQATVKDSGGNLLSGVVVNFSAPTSGASATLSAPSAITNSSGVASITATANASVGSYSVTASVSGVTTSATFSLTNSSGPPANVTAVGGTPQSAAISTAFGTALQAKVTDSFGDSLSGVTVNFAAPASGASATLSAPSAITNASGIASVTATANSTLGGPYTVNATVSGVSSPATFSLTNIVAPPASITVTGGNNQSATVNTAFATALTAVVKDSNGNTMSGISVTFGVPASGAGATVSPAATVVTNSSGVATVTATANGTAGQYNITASVSGVSTPATFSLTNNAGPPASVTAVGGTPQSTTIGTAFGSALQAKVTDASGNLLSGVTVNFAAPASGASATLSAASATTNSAGIASVNATANSTTGAYSVNATVSGIASPAVFSLTNATGGAASITPSGTPQSTTVNTAFGSAFQITVKDSGGNLLSGVTVTFTAPSSGASATLLSATAMTNSSGVASVTATANKIAGAYAVTATVGSLNTTFNLTNNPGPLASLTATAGTPQSALVSTAFATLLQATAADSFGNVLSGVSVTFTPPATGASGTFTGNATVTTNAQGIATAPAFTANATTGTYTVTAAAGSLSANFSLTNIVARLAFAVQPPSGVTGIALSPAPVVQVQDAQGNLIVTSTAAITVTSTPSGVSATQNAVNGVAAFGSLVFNTAGTYTLTATSPGLAAMTSNAFVISAAPAGPPAYPVADPAVFIDLKNASVLAGITHLTGGAVGRALGKVKTVSVLVDNSPVGTASYGLYRPDVPCVGLPISPGCPNVGFFYSLDPSKLAAGPHTLQVSATDEWGNVGSSTVNVTVSASLLRLAIESPLGGSTLAGMITVTGWAADLDNSPIGPPQVKVDGATVGTATYGASRSDVCADFPLAKACPNVGFTYQLNGFTLAAGTHVITVSAADAVGSTGSASVTITVPAHLPLTYLETPGPGSVLSGLVKMTGWALNRGLSDGSPVPGVQVQVDGKSVGAATLGVARADVCAVDPAADPCPNVGFTYQLDTTTLTVGAHTVTMQALNADGTAGTGLWTALGFVVAP